MTRFQLILPSICNPMMCLQYPKQPSILTQHNQPNNLFIETTQHFLSAIECIILLFFCCKEPESQFVMLFNVSSFSTHYEQPDKNLFSLSDNNSAIASMNCIKGKWLQCHFSALCK